MLKLEQIQLIEVDVWDDPVGSGAVRGNTGIFLVYDIQIQPIRAQPIQRTNLHERPDGSGNVVG